MPEAFLVGIRCGIIRPHGWLQWNGHGDMDDEVNDAVVKAAIRVGAISASGRPLLRLQDLIAGDVLRIDKVLV